MKHVGVTQRYVPILLPPMATRRPARSAKQKKNYDDEQYEQEPETAEYEEPVKKRAKKTKTATGTVAQAPKKNVRGKRGLLSQLTEFPLDVLFEVCVSLCATSIMFMDPDFWLPCPL